MEKKYSEKQMETIKLLKSAISEESKKATLKKFDSSFEKPKWKRIDYEVKGIDKIKEFKNYNIKNIENVFLDENVKTNLRISNYFKNESDNFSNFKRNIVIKDDIKDPIYIEMKLDEKNPHLVDVINIEIEEEKKAKIYIDYSSIKEGDFYHNGYISIKAKKSSNLDVFVIQNINLYSENFLSVDLELLDDAILNFYNVEFGAKVNVASINSNIIGNRAENLILPIYIADKERKVDLEYSLHFKGKLSKASIDARGLAKDKATKVFRGNLIFEKDSTKSEGEESEFSIILGKNVNSNSIPALFCEEDDVIGAHSASIGKIDEDKLFYLMSRGFSEKEAKKLVIESAFSPLFDQIDDEEILNKLKLELEGRV